MRRYETIFIIKPNIDADGITAITDRVSGIIKDFDGTLVTVDKWGLKKLAYNIGKESQGMYIYVEYGSKPAAVVEIERILKIDDRILKFMTVKTQEVFDINTPVRKPKTISDSPEKDIEDIEVPELED
ncbi:MAG: 30S ribosomal protein S6 [Deltaproteobacteria bacterium RIFOXYD12_FULL_50_9]|nr:MAG: 30S ribosomal protein S6 [Deltaproteobacteria bacterium RIFOXYD12_FULL_50_9]